MMCFSLELHTEVEETCIRRISIIFRRVSQIRIAHLSSVGCERSFRRVIGRVIGFTMTAQLDFLKLTSLGLQRNERVAYS